MPEWWQDESLWRDLGPFLFPQAMLSRADETTDELLDQLDLAPGARILDVGCGVGRILVPLVQRGFRAVGVDTCARYRQEARQRAQAAGVEIDIRSRSVFDLGLAEGERFDAVLDVFAVIGYADNPVNDILAVEQLRDALAPGGKLLVQTRNPATATGNLHHRSAEGQCLEQRSFDRNTQLMTTRWQVTSRGRQRVYKSQVRVYSAQDLRELFELCGLADIETIDVPSEETVTVIGTRPAT